MKRIICFVLVFVSLCSLAFAEEGIFVPGYQTFMSEFSQRLKQIDPDLNKTLEKEYKRAGKWAEDDSSVYIISGKPRFSPEEANGFLKRFLVDIPSENMARYRETFEEIMVAAAESISQTVDTQTFLEDINAAYVIDSPANSVTMYYQHGVYTFRLSKYNTKYEFCVAVGVME